MTANADPVALLEAIVNADGPSHASISWDDLCERIGANGGPSLPSPPTPPSPPPSPGLPEEKRGRGWDRKWHATPGNGPKAAPKAPTPPAPVKAPLPAPAPLPAVEGADGLRYPGGWVGRENPAFWTVARKYAPALVAAEVARQVEEAHRRRDAAIEGRKQAFREGFRARHVEGWLEKDYRENRRGREVPTGDSWFNVAVHRGVSIGPDGSVRVRPAKSGRYRVVSG